MHTKPTTSGVVVLARMFWLLIGPATLSITAIAIAENHTGWFGPRSIGFLVVLGLVILSRWLDPETSDGDPVTPKQRGIYMILAVIFGLTGWAAANMLGVYWQAA